MQRGVQVTERLQDQVLATHLAFLSVQRGSIAAPAWGSSAGVSRLCHRVGGWPLRRVRLPDVTKGGLMRLAC